MRAFPRDLLDRFGRRLWPGRLVKQALKEWPMTERMTQTFHFLDAAAPSPGSTPGSGLSLPAIRLDEGETGEDRIVTALAGLAATGGTLHLPPGRVELRHEIPLPSGVTLAGVGSRTELVFRGVRFGFVISGSPGTPAAGIEIRDLSLSFHEAVGAFPAAVLVTRARNLQFSDLDLTAPAGEGFLLADDVRGLRLDRCRIRNASGNGLLMVRTVSDVTLSACTVERSAGSGLLLADWRLVPNADPLDFGSQAGDSPVAFTASDPGPCRISLVGCAVRGNRKMGICTDGGGLIRVSGCEIADNECEGITLDNGTWGCLVEGSRIRSNGRRAAQSEHELHEDFVHGDGRLPDGSSQVKLPGVSLDNSAFCSILNCLIEGNYGEGVKFVRAGHGCTVARNTIAWNNRGYSKGHPHFGVRLGADPRQHPGQFDFPANAIRVEDNVIIGGHTAGILLNEGAVFNVVRGNRISGAVEADIVNRSRGSNLIET